MSTALALAQSLLARAAHPGTPEQEARTSAMILVRRIATEGLELCPTGTALELAMLRAQVAQLNSALSIAQIKLSKKTTEVRSEARRSRSKKVAAKVMTPRRIIRADFASVCTSCGDPFAVGDRVAWRKGEGCLCLNCHRAKVAA